MVSPQRIAPTILDRIDETQSIVTIRHFLLGQLQLRNHCLQLHVDSLYASSNRKRGT